MICVPNLGFMGGGSRNCDIRPTGGGDGALVPSSCLRLDTGVGLGEVTLTGGSPGRPPFIAGPFGPIVILGGGGGDERTFVLALCAGGTRLLRGGGVLGGWAAIRGTLGVTGIIPCGGIGVADPMFLCAWCAGPPWWGATGVGIAPLCMGRCRGGLPESNLRLGLLGSGALGIMPGV